MLKLNDAGEVIARRELTLDAADKVTVLIGRPQKLPDHEDWYCPYQITGVRSGRVRCAIGVDPMQALVPALSMAGAELYTCEEYEDGRLTRDCGAVKGDLGIPVPDSISDLLPDRKSE